MKIWEMKMSQGVFSSIKSPQAKSKLIQLKDTPGARSLEFLQERGARWMDGHQQVVRPAISARFKEWPVEGHFPPSFQRA